MSRIGNKPIAVPSNVEVKVSDKEVAVKGPKGSLVSPNFQGLKVDVSGGQLKISRTIDDKDTRAKHGLLRSLLANSIEGTTNGFKVTLLLQGVGYKANKKGNTLVLNLGYSHDVNFEIPKDVKVEVPEVTKIIIEGIDKQRVGQIAADIRKFRKPEPYKGKGIRREDEKIRRKAGKTGKK